jgi:hypothetical protein
VQQVVAQLPWGHNTHLLGAVKSTDARQGSALTKFSRTLPAVQSELAQQIIKDPYSLPSELFSARAATKSLSNMLFETRASRWGWRSIDKCRRFQIS